MGIYYDPKKEPKNRWVVSYEKTDYTEDELKTDRSTSNTYTVNWTTEECDGPIIFGNNLCWWKKQENHSAQRDDTTKNAVNAQLNADGEANKRQLEINKSKNQAYDNVIAISNRTQGGDYVNQRESIRQILNAKAVLPENLPTGSALYTPKPTNLGNYVEQTRYASDDPESGDYYARDENGQRIVEPDDWSGDLRLKRATVTETVWVPNEAENAANQNYNNEQEAISQKNNETNKYNKKFNASLKALSLELEKEFKTFYQTEKLQQWDPALGAKPQYGDFDPTYYKKQNPNVVKQWQDAVVNDDIDITERYGENGFYLQHYTTQGKAAGLRGNAPEKTEAAAGYVETAPTDKELQDVRNLQLGIDTATQTTRLLNIPEVADEWEKAKNRDPYWVQLAKDNYLDIDKPDEFVTLFKISDRPEDKQVSLNYNINTGTGVTELEDALTEAVGTKAAVDVKKFGALTQDVLKQTIAEMKKAKAKENALTLMRGFGGFSEIVDINKELASSILGDSGVGGVLAFTSKGNPEADLEKQLQNITGVNNNLTYNWQQWFDNQLKTRYQQDLELGYTDSEAEQKIKIEADFARNFITEYLVPRFNTSRSMDEFAEYLDVRQEEQNPFQTQDMVNAVKQVADLRSKRYLDQLKNTDARYFNADFYFNPSGDVSRTSQYAEQASTVAEDWEAAKKGDPYWQQQAYRFGVDVNDKAAFARMHFQVKGQGKGYDAADDILNAGKVNDQIYNTILPALKEEALKQGTVFGQFITPEEFADEMLKGLDPNDKTQWQEVLKRYGLTDFKGTLEELKEYIAETLRTGSAQRIREEIKYLNERREEPTQAKLGLTYIQRPEDYKTTSTTGETELYKTFQSAGYQGTEDEFYKTMFPDVDRTEQQLLTKAGTGQNLALNKIDFSDPFASLGTIEGFFGADETPTKTTSRTSTTSTDQSDSFFKLGLKDEEEDGYQKSKSGEQILGEFTSMFKGFS